MDKPSVKETKKRNVSKNAIKRKMGTSKVDTEPPSRVNSTLDQLAVLSAMRNSDEAKFR